MTLSDRSVPSPFSHTPDGVDLDASYSQALLWRELSVVRRSS
uniref:Uncharacterized protein n=1 Tax=Anguilla anguilla TaxID=7936 RepID=A0A0E9PCY5_ANGAN